MQLGELHTIEADLQALGVQTIAISGDGPAKLKATADKHQMSYQLYSGGDMEAARAFGIAFKVSPSYAKRLVEYGIDLSGSSYEQHGELPVPAVFLIGADGLIHFNYVNPNYKVRCPAEVVLAAARAATRSKE